MLKLLGIALLTLILSFTTDTRPQEKEPVVKLTVPEWSVVLSGIAKLPLEQSQGIYMKIITQIQQQLDTIPKKK